MRKLSKYLSFVAYIAFCILLTACSSDAGTPSNGGIPTDEQLSAAVEKLGDDVKSLSFSADGVIYQFPINTSDMFDAGWYFDSGVKSDLKSIPANTLVSPAVKMSKKAADGYGATSCAVKPMNKSYSDCTLEETLIYELTFSKSNGTTVILPAGITWNSTFDEVKAAYNPEEAVDRDGIKYIRITSGDYNYSMKIDFNSTDNTIDSVEFKGRL